MVAGVVSFSVGLATFDETSVECTETAGVKIGGVSATGAIIDNDSPSIARVVAEEGANPGADSPDAAVVEGQTLRFTVVLSGAPTRDARFPWALSGSAIGEDLGTMAFTAGVRLDPATGELIVPAGVTSFTIVLPTIDDTRVEGTEAVHFKIRVVSWTGSILDHDPTQRSTVW